MDFLQALSHFLERSQHGTIHNPSAFLTIALTNASGGLSPIKSATSFGAKAEYMTSFCPSANHLLNIMAKEGFSSRDLDPDCQAYLARAKPAAQTQVFPVSKTSGLFCQSVLGSEQLLSCLQVLQDFLEAWRTGKIRNASAYLTDLLTKASKDMLWSDQDALPFMDVPPNITPQVSSLAFARNNFLCVLISLVALQPRKVAVPIASPHHFVPADASEISFLAANVKIGPILSASSPDIGRDGLFSNSWPAIGVDQNKRAEAPKHNPAPESEVHDAILRYFAKQFIPMGRDELQLLQLADLETIL